MARRRESHLARTTDDFWIPYVPLTVAQERVANSAFKPGHILPTQTEAQRPLIEALNAEATIFDVDVARIQHAMMEDALSLVFRVNLGSTLPYSPNEHRRKSRRPALRWLGLGEGSNRHLKVERTVDLLETHHEHIKPFDLATTCSVWEVDRETLQSDLVAIRAYEIDQKLDEPTLRLAVRGYFARIMPSKELFKGRKARYGGKEGESDDGMEDDAKHPVPPPKSVTQILDFHLPSVSPDGLSDEDVKWLIDQVKSPVDD